MSSAGGIEAVTLARGSLLLPQAVYAHYFSGLDGVALLRRGDDLLIMPVRHAAAGGYVLKQRNAAGDRVVCAADFFREQGLDDNCARRAAPVWRDDLAALTLPGLFAGRGSMIAPK